VSYYLGPALAIIMIRANTPMSPTLPAVMVFGGPCTLMVHHRNLCGCEIIPLERGDHLRAHGLDSLESKVETDHLRFTPSQ
jgi:hypothetical protein